MPPWSLPAACEVDDAAFAAREIDPAGRAPFGEGAARSWPHDFRTGGNRVETPVIGILPGKIITEHLTFDIAPEDGDKRPDIARDLVKIAVIERHGVNGNRATGFVQGLRAAARGDRLDRLPRPPQHRGGGGGLCRHGAGGEPAGRDRGRLRGGRGRAGAGRTGAAGGGADEPGAVRGGARRAGRAARRRHDRWA